MGRLRATLLCVTFIGSVTACAPGTLVQSSVSPVASPSASAMLASQGVAAMDLLTPSNGWVLAPGGLLRTIDSGRHWTNISPGGQAVHTAFFLTPLVGWAAGWTVAQTIAIYRTSDGGASWRSVIVTPTDLDPAMSGGDLSIDFADRQHGWLKRSWGNTANYQGAVFRSIDGGSTWSEIARTAGGPIRFTDTMTGWSVYGSLYVTRDAGYIWERVLLPGGARRLPTFFDPSNGVAPIVSRAGDGSSLDFYTTTDSGHSWILRGQRHAPLGNADTAAIISPTTWLASLPLSSQTSGVFLTRDAGRQWTQVAAITEFIEEFAFADSLAGWGRTSYGSCARRGVDCVYHRDLLATRDGGRTWGRLDVTPTTAPFPSVEASPTPAFSVDQFVPDAVQRLNPRVGFMTGWMGASLALARTTDAGASWHRTFIPATGITVLRFIDQNVGWAAGFVLRGAPLVACWQAPPTGRPDCRGVVLRTEDGGQTWQEMLSTGWGGYGGLLPQLQAVDGELVWVLAPTSPCDSICPAELRRTVDGGRTWTMLLRGDIRAMRFASTSRGWVALVDPDGAVTVRTTSDGGDSWSSGQRVGTTTWLPTLDAATTQTAWLLTGDLRSCSASTCGTYELYRTDDGGMSWKSLGNPKDSPIGDCSMGFLEGPLFASTTRGWFTLNLGAGGGNGPGGVLTTEDGGRTWRCSTPPTNTRLLSAADPVHVWVWSEKRVTGATGLYATDDGGRTWHRLDLSALS